MAALIRTYSDQEERFFRRLVAPEEDRNPEIRWSRWHGRGVRWFRSPNVVCMEHYRRPEVALQIKLPAV